MPLWRIGCSIEKERLIGYPHQAGSDSWCDCSRPLVDYLSIVRIHGGNAKVIDRFRALRFGINHLCIKGVETMGFRTEVQLHFYIG